MDYIMPKGINDHFLDQTSAAWTSISYYSNVTDAMRHANILLPEGYTQEKTYPVLYLLHGIGGDEDEWKLAGPEYILYNLAAQKKTKKMITVLCNVRAWADDRVPTENLFNKRHFEAFDGFREDLLDSLIPFIRVHFNVSEKREDTAIAGLSMGGREALYIGISRQERFGAVGAFSPAFGLFPYTNNGVTEKGLFTEEEFTLRPEYADNTTLIIMNGNQDEVVRHEPEHYHQILEKNHCEHLYYTIDGGHDFDVWANGLYHFVQLINGGKQL